MMTDGYNIEHQEREIIQSRLLAFLFSNSTDNPLVLKGGMAFRAAFQSSRMTKDIDLDQLAGRSLESLQHLVRRAINLTARNFLTDVRVSEPKQTDTTARWKISGVTRFGTSIAFSLEVSRRGFTPQNHIIKKRYFPHERSRISAVQINVLDADALAASKIYALWSPNRVAPRDLYDLYFLIQMNIKPDPDFFSGIKNKKEFIHELWEKINIIEWPQFQTEVLPFLDKAEAASINEEVFNEIRLGVGESVEEWIVSDLSHKPTHSRVKP